MGMFFSHIMFILTLLGFHALNIGWWTNLRVLIRSGEHHSHPTEILPQYAVSPFSSCYSLSKDWKHLYLLYLHYFFPPFPFSKRSYSDSPFDLFLHWGILFFPIPRKEDTVISINWFLTFISNFGYTQGHLPTYQEQGMGLVSLSWISGPRDPLLLPVIELDAFQGISPNFIVFMLWINVW